MTTETTRPTARGRRTLEAIDAAARNVIAEKGFLKMTVSDIVEQAGRSPASFYNYYDSKEALIEHWARKFQDEARRKGQVAEQTIGTDIRAQVEGAVRAHWETYREHLAEMVAVFQLAMVNDDFARTWEQMCAEPITRIARSITSAQGRGFCPGLDPMLGAKAIISMLNLFCYENLANGKAAEVDDEKCIATLTNAWYRSIYWSPNE